MKENKKFLALCLAAVMAASTSTVVFAEEADPTDPTTENSPVTADVDSPEETTGELTAPIQVDTLEDNTTAEVTGEAELRNALNNSDVTTINLNSDINLSNFLSVTRSLTINGNGHTLHMPPKMATAAIFSNVPLTVKNLTISGDTIPKDTPLHGSLYGISASAGLTMDGVKMIDIRCKCEGDTCGMQQGYSVYVTSGDISITNCEFSGFQKNAIDINTTGQINITENTITGRNGAQGTKIAQNGIVIRNGSGTVSNNNISGLVYNNPGNEWDHGSYGIIAMGDGSFNIDENTLTNIDNAFDIEGRVSATISNNTSTADHTDLYSDSTGEVTVKDNTWDGVYDGTEKGNIKNDDTPSGGNGGGSSIPGTGAPITTGGKWVQSPAGWWYKNADGSYPANQWKYLDGGNGRSSWYWFDQNGYITYGWQYIYGNWYYMNRSGEMQTGWQFINNKWYYLNQSGAMATGWVQDGDKWYYMNDDGSMHFGWLNWAGYWYHLDSHGVMSTGWKYLGGEWYYLYPANGRMAANTTTPDGYRVDASGAWVR